MYVNFDLMEKDELQRLCVELFKQFENFKNSIVDHLQRLKDFEIEKDVIIEKIKYVEDDLMNSELPLDNSFDSDLSIDKIASFSHAMSVHRTMFVKPSMSHNHTQVTCGDKGASDKNCNSIPTCHHCGISGHIRPNCFQIRSQRPWDRSHLPRDGEPGFENQVKNLSDQVKLISEKLERLTPNERRYVLANNKKKTSKQVWVKKEDNLCLVAHTALKILDTCLWYLDSDCFKHMTGDKTLLKEVQMGKGGRITYRDGSQSKVIGKWIIDILGLGASQEALYVEGLKENLLSISRFCDNDLVVQFSKKECNIFDSNGKWLMGRERTADNCYGLPGLTLNPQIICNKVAINDSELWHQRLGHLNFTDMLKIASKDIVKDLSKMEKTGKGICGPCQLGKQARAAHKKTLGMLTSRNLELLHMDLMGPTRTASLGGRKYILVVVDDFSRYTWVIFFFGKNLMLLMQLNIYSRKFKLSKTVRL